MAGIDYLIFTRSAVWFELAGLCLLVAGGTNDTEHTMQPLPPLTPEPGELVLL